ncbi:MAG: putative lipid II flippase FtsW [Deltaproteobacteria bacterium]|nr:putative lipid II flippase FtsW [Deltaproteobacteria bacterium]
MSETRAAEGTGSGIDRTLFVSVILLLGLGIVMVYSASAVRAAHEQNDPAFFLIRQTIYAVVGITVMLIGACIDYNIYKKFIYPFFGLAIIGLILCHTPIGRTVNGASRWIGVGPVNFQPSEAVKLALVLWLSYSLAKKSDKIKSFSVGFLPHLLVPGFVIVLCLLQPDFGTSVVLAIVTFTLLFVAGAKLGYMMLACMGAAPIAYYLVAGSEYRLNRILAFLDPISNRYEHGYQLTQSLFGFGAGGLWGVGLGDGLQKLFFLPEAHNDFVASIIAEELGAVGVWLMLTIYCVVVARGVMIALRAPDEFGTYVGFGITVLIGVQVLANLGVTMGLLPTKGLNLPFISYGGSSLVMSLFAIGVMLNISRPRNEEPRVKESGSLQNNSRRPAVVAEAGKA